MRSPRAFGSRRWTLVVAVAIASAVPVALPASAEEPASEEELLSIEVETPRPLAAAVRELSARHGLVITYEDPRWAHESDVEDVSDQYPWVAERIAKGEPQQHLLQPRAGSLTFSYRWSDLEAKRGGPGSMLERLARDSTNRFEVRYQDGVYHLIPTQSLDAEGHLVPHVSPFDLPIAFPVERRTINETLQVIMEAVNAVSETPVLIGIVMITPFERLGVELGSDGRTARELLVEAMEIDDVKISWLLFYDPMLRRYLFSVYPVRAAALAPKDDPADER